jgi:hypothetical protein
MYFAGKFTAFPSIAPLVEKSPPARVIGAASRACTTLASREAHRRFHRGIFL